MSLNAAPRVDADQPVIWHSGTTGLGFAAPINVATDVMHQILDTGRVRRAILGVDTRDITPEVARYFDLPIEEGVVVVRGYPAAQAGIRAEDFIVALDGERIENGGELRRLLRTKRPGDVVRVEILRGSRRQTLNVRLGEA